MDSSDNSPEKPKQGFQLWNFQVCETLQSHIVCEKQSNLSMCPALIDPDLLSTQLQPFTCKMLLIYHAARVWQVEPSICFNT